VIAGILLGTVCSGAGLAAWMISRDPKSPDIPAIGVATGEATVRRQTLKEHTEVDGRLGFAGGYDIVNQENGLITMLPSVGKVIKSGHVLYRVDGKPVIFLRGNRSPLYRTLSQGMKGPDVKQLNAAVVKLGYDDDYGPEASSSYFGWATKHAVERLQEAVNAKETGELGLGQAVFLPADELRITKVTGIYGGNAPTGQTLLKASSTRPVVSISMDASLATHVRRGDKVTVGLPTGKDAKGVVTSVGRVATTTSESSTIPVEVGLSGAKRAGGLDAATVKVVITANSRKNVLTVPVTALLAMAGGGYSVEVIGATNARGLTPVKIGMFDGAAGMVEITSGLTEGRRVVVPSS
jgi:peptidoglycan hydrolase-like protein with peptidoglycan-binding domain